jgi:NAD(P)H-dependent FMN reductase
MNNAQAHIGRLRIMLKIAIVIGTTRPNRKSEQVARWVFDLASQRGDAEY